MHPRLAQMHQSGATDGQVMTWDAALVRWVPADPAGGGGSLVLDDLTDVDTTSTPPADGDRLSYDAASSLWVPAAPADGLPVGGTTGQVLTKQSGTDGDADWETPSGGGGSGWTISTKTTNYTAAAGDLILADGTAGAITITLPAGTAGDEILVKRINSAGSAVTIVAPAGVSIEDQAGFNLGAGTDMMHLIYVGSSRWRVISMLGTYALREPTLSIIASGTYGDHFLGTSLDAKWTRVTYVSGDETYRAVDGSYLSSASRATPAYYYQPSPAGDFSIVWAGSVLAAAGSMFGLMIVDATGKGVFGGYYNSAPDGSILGNLTGGTYPGGFTGGPAGLLGSVAMNGTTKFWIKLRKNGAAYLLAFSTNGETWSSEVTFTPTAFTPARIGFGVTFGTMTRTDTDLFDQR